MKDLVIMQDNQAVTTSLQIAEVFGKQHSHVIEAIESKIQSVENSTDYKKMFEEGSYKDKRNRSQKQYLLNRDGFTFIAFGFTGSEADKFKLDFIKAFNKMEESIKSQLAIPASPMEALELMFNAQKDVMKEVNELDNRVINLEENVVLSPGEYSYIGGLVSKRVRTVRQERRLDNVKEVNCRLFKALNTDVCKVSGVRTRSQIRKNSVDEVSDLIIDWHPSKATLIEIEKALENSKEEI